MQSGHAHQREEADGFERDCFAAGIRTCHDNHVIPVSDFEINRNHLFRVDQRMPALPDPDNMICVQNRPHRILRKRQRGFREDEVELCHVGLIVPQRCQLLSCQRREG